MALFVQAMLSKVSNDNYTRTKYVWDFNGDVSNSDWQRKTLASFTETVSRTYNYYLKWLMRYKCQVILSNGDSQIAKAASSDTTDTASWTFTSTVWNVIKVEAFNYNYSGTTNVIYQLYYNDINIPKTVSTRKSKPRELKSIWEKARSTLYGYHTDNTRYTGE